MQKHLKSSHFNSINESDQSIVKKHSKKNNQKINSSKNASIVTLSLICMKNVDSNFLTWLKFIFINCISSKKIETKIETKCDEQWSNENAFISKKMIIKLIIRIAITISEDNKNDQWYMNTIAIVYITHDLILFMIELNNQFEEIEIVIDQKIQIRDVETINLDVILNNDENIKKEFINIHLHDVYYCLEVNSNLLFLSVLKEKDFTFNVKNDVLRVLNNDDD